MSPFRRWIIMTCLCLSGAVIYLLPFLREVYYIPLQKALALSNTQLGLLMSVFGVTAMASYFPGGWLADRVSPRILITLSMMATGISGLYFSTFPSFGLSVAVHGFWGISCTLTFWAALIKATRNWAPAAEQGRAFGILESGRGIAEVASSMAFLAVFAKLGGGDSALSRVVLLFSLLNIGIGVMAWFTLDGPGRDDSGEREKRQKVGFRDVVTVLKMPAVWLISVIILTAYSSYWGSYYFTPYATDVFMMSVVFGGAIGVGKMWIKPLAALGAGFLADRAGPSRTIAWCFLVLIFSFGLFVLAPGGPGLVVLLVANTALASFAIFALRGIYFALLEECGTPLALTGTVTGIVSVIGYAPDIFMPVAGGAILDRYPGGLGYRYLFLLIAFLCLIGLIAALIVLKRYSVRKGPRDR